MSSQGLTDISGNNIQYSSHSLNVYQRLNMELGSPKYIWARMRTAVLIGRDPARRYWSAKIDDISLSPLTRTT